MSSRISQRTLTILKLCERPQRYVDLKAATGLSDTGLYKKLNMLMEKGWIRKLPDGSYIITEEGRKAWGEYEVMELVKEAVRRYGAAAVKEAVSQLMRKRIEAAVTEVEVVETLIRVLRAWATVTGFWLLETGKIMEGVGEEERRALSIIEVTLRKFGGERWYRKYSTLLYSNERYLLEEGGEEGVSLPLSVFVLKVERGKVIEAVEKILSSIPQERLDLLNTSLRDAILFILRLVEERKRELEKLFAEKEEKKKKELPVPKDLSSGSGQEARPLLPRPKRDPILEKKMKEVFLYIDARDALYRWLYKENRELL